MRYVLLAAVISIAPVVAAQSSPPIDVNDLADYRLTDAVFTQFVDASRQLVAVTRTESRFTYAPLFTKEIALSGDAPEMATGLMARLENDPALAAALAAANVTAREYSKFALTLVAAHLAHEFISAGVLKGVPSGAPAQNVDFIGAHRTSVTDVLALLGISD